MIDWGSIPWKDTWASLTRYLAHEIKKYVVTAGETPHHMVDVAQLARASDCGSEGCEIVTHRSPFTGRKIKAPHYPVVSYRNIAWEE